MTGDHDLQPIFMSRDGVRLAHFEAGSSASVKATLVLINGWTGDHGIFSPQIAHFSREHRVVAVDLRGHGASDAPRQAYTVSGFADDVAWQCDKLGLEKPVVIGHSFGGAVALEMCGRYPGLAAALVMIDSIVMTPPQAREDARMRHFLARIAGPDYLAASRASAWEMGCDFDDPLRRQAIFDAYILQPCENTPQHVAHSALENMVDAYDPVPAAAACKIPMAYISADVPMVNAARDLDRLKSLCPQLVTSKTMLAGHFCTIEVADQVNAMLERFLKVGVAKHRLACE